MTKGFIQNRTQLPARIGLEKNGALHSPVFAIYTSNALNGKHTVLGGCFSASIYRTVRSLIRFLMVLYPCFRILTEHVLLCSNLLLFDLKSKIAFVFAKHIQTKQKALLKLMNTYTTYRLQRLILVML